MPLRYRAISKRGEVEALDCIRKMPSEQGHTTNMANSAYYSSEIIFVRSEGSNFQCSATAGLGSGPLGNGVVKPFGNGSELLIEITFAFPPKSMYLLLGASCLLLAVYLFIAMGEDAAFVGMLGAAVFGALYLQQLHYGGRLLVAFSKYYGEDLNWERF